MPDPGAIIKIISCMINVDGRIRLKGTGTEEYALAGQHDAKAVLYQLTTDIAENNAYVIRIPGNAADGAPLVSQQGFFPSLTAYYFNRPAANQAPTSPANVLSIWQRRWAEAAREWQNMQWLQTENLIHSLPSHLHWAEATYYKNGNEPSWVMPAFISAYADGLGENSAPCFSAQNHFVNSPNSIHTVQPCCYRSLTGFPAKYSGRIQMNNTKNLTLIVHGFLKPEIAHLKLWRHTVNYEFEQRYWREKIGPVPADLFDQCQTTLSNGDCCRFHLASDFYEFHKKIERFIDAYSKKIVTFLEQAETVKIRTAAYGDLCYLHLNALHNETIRFETFYPRLAMTGLCHNWTDDKPILHLFIKTFFAGKKNTIWGKDDYNFLGRHEDASCNELALEDIRQIL